MGNVSKISKGQRQTWFPMRKIKQFSIFIIFFAALLVGGCSTTGNTVVEKGTPQGLLPPAHHTKNGFRNIYDNTEHGLADYLRWKLGYLPDEEPPITTAQKIPYVPDIVAPDYQLIYHPDPAKIQITWIGHATFLIQVEGINILTDPVFSSSISPVGGIGYKRRSPPGIPFDRLPPIHAVLISHNHYDHLDLYTVKKLGNKPKYFIPLKLGAVVSRSRRLRTMWRWIGGIHRCSKASALCLYRASISPGEPPVTAIKRSGQDGYWKRNAGRYSLPVIRDTLPISRKSEKSWGRCDWRSCPSGDIGLVGS